MSSLNIIFMGTPDFAVPALTALINSFHTVVGVYAQPPKPSGRGHKLTKTPVHQLADHYNIPVFTPKLLRNDEVQKDFKNLGADLGVVAAYGLLLPKEILEAPSYGCINIHGSLLPRWRGAAPVHRSILEGDTETGITLMQMDVGLDTGDMLLKESVAIRPETTGQSLHDQLSVLGAEMLIELLDNHGKWQPEKQDNERATYAHKLEKSEALLDFTKPAEVLERQVRAFTPWPGSHFTWQGKQIKVLQASTAPNITHIDPGAFYVTKTSFFIGCSKGVLEVKELQLPGKKPMDMVSFINGYKPCSTDCVEK